jgi:hypothetical protein
MDAPAAAPPGCCALVYTECPAKIDANEARSITRVGFLIADTPYGAVKLRTLARTLFHRDFLVPPKLGGNDRRFLNWLEATFPMPNRRRLFQFGVGFAARHPAEETCCCRRDRERRSFRFVVGRDWQILLQKSHIAERQFFRQKARQAVIAD